MIKKLKKLLFIVTCLLLLLISQGVSAVFAQGPANNSPVLDASGDPALDSIDEDVNVTGNAGTLVSVLIASVAPLDLITDADGDPEGLAIISVNDDEGEWEYSTDGGANWLTLNPSPDSARLLASDVMTTYIRFVPNPDFNGPVDFGITFRAWDQTSDSNGGTADTTTNGGETAFSVATETAGVTVNPVNDPPDAVDDTAATPTDTPRTVVVLGNDTDPDGDTLTVTTVGDPGNGTAALNLDDTVTYTPNLSFTGDDVFTYTIRDPASLTDTASVIVTVGVTNNSPVAVNDTATTFENTPLAVAVLNNDSDPDGDTLAVIAAGSPANGTASTNGASVTYIPNLNFSGSDAFTYTISDGDLTAAANVNVTVKSLGTNFWEEDRFDELVSGPLAGQNGWQLAAPYRSSPQVVPDGSGGKFLRIDARPGETIVVGKDIPDQTSGLHTFVVRARVLGDTDPAEPTLAKIEFRTDPSTGWTKKFQLYFGAHFRINYDPSGAAKIILPDNQLQTNRWYHIRGEMDLDHELLDVWLDNVLVAEDIPMHPGPLTDLGISGWDRGRTDFVEIDDLIGFQNDENMPAGACVWINSSGGLWTTASNWSTGAVPDASCHAFITLDGTYTVTLDTSRTVGSLTLGGGAGEQTLWIKGNSTLGNATLTVNNDLRNAGLMRMESINFGYASNLTISSGILTNTGVISVNQGTGGVRTISGNLVNQGTVNVNHDLTFNGEFTNTSTVDIAAGKKVSLSGSTRVFNQNGGTIAGAGVLEVSASATLNFNNGTIVDTLPLLRNANLNFGPSASGQASFILIGSNNTLSGDIGAEQTVWIRGDSTVGNATATAASGFTNAGLMRMESINFGYASNLTISSGILTNTGVISVNQGTGGVRTISGNLVNQGTVNVNHDLTFNGEFTNTSTVDIAAGKKVSLSNGDVFNQNAGAITGQGVLELIGAATLNFNNGTIVDTLPLLRNANLNFGPSASGQASFILIGSNSTLSGSIGAEQTVWIRGDSTVGNATATAASGFTNAGLMRMESINFGYASNLTISSGILTNTGVISVNQGSGGVRAISGNLVNQGALEINLGSGQALTVSGANFDNAPGGVIQGSGTINVSGTTFGNAGEVRPGLPLGILNVTGNFPQTPSGALSIEIGGLIAASEFDQLKVSQQATLSGTLNLSLVNSFEPALGDSFQILTCKPCSGEFAIVTGQEIGNGKRLEVIYTPGTATIAGDVTLEVVPSTEVPITGLSASNDSPTVLGSATTLSATITGGSNVTYAWNFGDGATGTGQVVTHIYPATGIYTAVVTATNPISTATAMTTISVIAANQAPNAVDDTATTLEDVTITISVLDNDTDPDGDTPTVTAADMPANGTASTDGTTVTYTPTLNFNGEDVFSYTVSDTGGLTDTATVTVTVAPVNDAPSFIKGSDQTVDEDAGPQTLANWATNISAGPADESGQSLTFSLTNDNNGLFAGQPALAADGTLTYELALNANGNALVTITLTDGGGTVNGGVDTSDPQSFTITVIPINDPPDAVDDTAETLEGTAVTIAVLDNDTDLENDPLTVTALGTPANGTASTNGATVVYTPTLNFNSTDVFSYTVSDGSLTDTATVTITVTPVNDAPDAVDDTAETLEDTPVTIAVLDNDTDLENDPLTVTALGPSANGTTSTDGTTVTYTPTLDFNGDDVFSYTISDGGLTDSAIVTVTVQPVPEGAILHFTPPTTTIPLGVTGLLTITVTPGTDPVNEVQIHGQVDPAHLRLLDVQPTGSLPQVLDPASFDPATGVFRYGAGLLGGVITEPFAALVLEVEAVATTTLTGTEVVFLSDFPPTDVSGPSGSVLAEAQNGVVIITPAATLQGTVDLQGRPAKPDPSWAIPLTVTLTPVGSSPVQTFPTTTDTSGVFTLTVITPGQYDVRVKGNHTLRNLAQSVDLVSGDNAYFLGTLLEGDVEVATTFNQVVLADFGLFSGSFNKCAGEAGFVANADLDESGCVALPDFGLLSGNFNKEGDIIVTATPSASLTSLRATDGQALLAFNADELTVVADEVVSLRVEVDPRGAQVNGAMVHLHFDPTLVEVVDVRLTNQLPFVLAEPWIDNQQGVVRFGAGMLGQTISERFSVASLSVKVKATTAGTSITPVVDIFPASDVSGPEGSVLAETKGITLKTEAGTGTEHTIFLPITIK